MIRRQGISPMRGAHIYLFILLGSLAAAAAAAPLQEISVTRDGQFIVSEANFMIDVPRQDVVAAFSSFSQLQRLNPAILESRVEPAADGRSLVTTRLRDCVAMFCRTVTLAEHVEVIGDGTIRSEIAPDQGDFVAGHAVWTFENHGPADSRDLPQQHQTRLLAAAGTGTPRDALGAQAANRGIDRESGGAPGARLRLALARH